MLAYCDMCKRPIAGNGVSFSTFTDGAKLDWRFHPDCAELWQDDCRVVDIDTTPNDQLPEQPVPAHFIAQAVEHLKHATIAQLAKHLGISRQLAERWAGQAVRRSLIYVRLELGSHKKKVKTYRRTKRPIQAAQR